MIYINIYIYIYIYSFRSSTTGKEYKINYSFNCDLSNVVYLIECNVCGVQYVGSTCTHFRLRFNNYKACTPDGIFQTFF